MSLPRLRAAGAAAAWAGAAASGAAQVLVFPRFSAEWLAPVCLVPLLLALRNCSAGRRFALGFLCGSVFWSGSCYWIYPVMRDYAGISPPVAGILFVLFFAVMAPQMGVFAVLAGRALSRPWSVPAVAVLWVAVEGTYQYLFFTWTLLGNAAVDFPVPHLLRLAPWTGVYGPSLVFALANAALAAALARRSPRPLAAVVPAAAVLLLPPLPSGADASQAARLVQPNVHPDLIGEGWVAEHGTQHLLDMLKLSAAPAATRPSMLVWPEYPVPAYFFEDPGSRAFFERVAVESGAYFIFNSITFEEGDRLRPRNSAVTLGPDGSLLSEYSKIHLVPFGEFVPWPFHYFVNKITLQAGNFRSGRQVTVAALGGGAAGTFICYESVFAQLVRRFTAHGAQVLVNISNDSWYGRSAAREQHLLIARMRAVENGRWILRATNDGVTAAISPDGSVSAALPSYQRGAMDVRFEYLTGRTAFVRFGQWLWWACLVAIISLEAWHLAGRRASRLA